MKIDDKGELDFNHDNERFLQTGVTSYFTVEFPVENIDAQWWIELKDKNGLSKEEITYYEGLMKLTKFDAFTLAIKPGKASSLKDKKFVLCVSDIKGNYHSSIDLEVAK